MRLIDTAADVGNIAQIHRPTLVQPDHQSGDIIGITEQLAGLDHDRTVIRHQFTGMTGHQQNPGTGYTLQLQESPALELEPLVRALGIDRVVTVPAFDVKAIDETLKDFLKAEGPSVLIARDECALLPSARKRWLPLEVIAEKCNGCTMCFRIGCPAILKSDELDEKTHRPKAQIDPLQCTGCEVCAQVCPRKAILFRDQMEASAS